MLELIKYISPPFFPPEKFYLTILTNYGKFVMKLQHSIYLELNLSSWFSF